MADQITFPGSIPLVPAKSGIIVLGDNGKSSVCVDLADFFLSGPTVPLDAASGLTRAVVMTTAGVERWALGTDETAETGNNTGCNLTLSACADDGSPLFTILEVKRADGSATAPQPFHLAGGGNLTGVVIDATSLIASREATDIVSALFGQPQPWTPALTFGGQNTGIIYGASTAGYAQRGAMVEFWLQLRLISKGSSTGEALIQGLPLMCDGSIEQPQLVVATGIASSNGSVVATVSGQTIRLYRQQDISDPSASLTDQDFEDAAVLTIKGSYPLETSS